jgi:Uma2 family endonuclease
MSIATKSDYTVAQYLEFERESELRHEFFQGEIHEMTGGTLDHIMIIMNLGFALRSRLPESDYMVLTSDMRVKAPQSRLFTYPDLVVVQGKPELDDDSRDTLLNPIVLIEVLSNSTEAYDRGEKFSMYREIPGFQEYLLVAQDRPEIDQYVRDADGNWLHSNYLGLNQTLNLQSVPCSIPLTTIFKKIIE